MNGSTAQPATRARRQPAAALRARRGRVAQLGRAGLAARGIVYGVIGLLSLEVALGVGGKTTGQTGALKRIAHQPLGAILLVILAAGLAGYAAWQLANAVAGLSGRDETLRRLSAGAGAVGYGLLCFTALEILTGSRPSGGAGSPKDEAAGVLGCSGGPVLLGAVAAGLIGFGLYSIADARYHRM